MALDQIELETRLSLESACRACKGHLFWFWWETPQRRVYSCADKDCGLFLIVPKVEEREIIEI